MSSEGKAYPSLSFQTQIFLIEYTAPNVLPQSEPFS